MDTFPPPRTPRIEAPPPPPRRRRRTALVVGGIAAVAVLGIAGAAIAVTASDDGADDVAEVELASQTAQDDTTSDAESRGSLAQLAEFGECVAAQLDDTGLSTVDVTGPELATTIADALRSAADAIEECADQLPEDLDVLSDLPLGPGLLPEDLDELTENLPEDLDELTEMLEETFPELGTILDELEQNLPSLDELEQSLPSLDELQDQLGELGGEIVIDELPSLDELGEMLDDALQGEGLDGLLDELFDTSDGQG